MKAMSWILSSGRRMQAAQFAGRLPRFLLGGKTGQRLDREMGLRTARDLLEHFPRRWIERGEMTDIASLPVGEQVTVVARVVSASRRPMHSRRGFIVDVTVTDEPKCQIYFTLVECYCHFDKFLADGN